MNDFPINGFLFRMLASAQAIGELLQEMPAREVDELVRAKHWRWKRALKWWQTHYLSKHWDRWADRVEAEMRGAR